MAASPDWVLSAHEFRTLWGNSTDAPLPHPLQLTIDRFASDDAETAASGETARRLAAQSYELKETAFEVMRRPSVSVSMMVAALPPSGPPTLTRVYAAWHKPDISFIARQQSTLTSTNGEHIALSFGRPNELGDYLDTLLSQFPGPGRLPSDNSVPLTRMFVDDITDSVVSPEARHNTAAAAFAHLPTQMVAELTMRAGSIAEAIPPTTTKMQCVDVRRDGRYALLLGWPCQAIPLKANSFATICRRRIAEVQKLHQEYWEDYLL